MTGHTPTPWRVEELYAYHAVKAETSGQKDRLIAACAKPHRDAAANAAFIVKACNTHEQMLAALKNVRKIISEAAMTGFNCHDGDWAERLFASQQVTSAAIKTADPAPSFTATEGK